MTDIPIARIKAQTADVYDRQAKVWHQMRDTSLYEQIWLDRMLAELPQTGAHVLDLGCGTGRPIAGYLLKRGHHVTGVDVSPTMIALARENFPQAEWKTGDMRTNSLTQDYDAVLSWDGFFHLSPQEQRTALPRLADLVRTGGSMLLTVGPEEGEVTGTVNDELVYHGSLAQADYIAILSDAGFAMVTVTPEDPQAWGRTILFATGKEG
ncbi:MAG: class I SAM-dependent DNA methyltransferase [Thalassovita sp.]